MNQNPIISPGDVLEFLGYVAVMLICGLPVLGGWVLLLLAVSIIVGIVLGIRKPIQ